MSEDADREAQGALRPKTRLHAAGAIASAAPLLVYVPLGLISLPRTLLM